MDWTQIANEGYRLWWRSMILTSVFILALVSTCTAGNQFAWDEWTRQQRADCNASGGTWTSPQGGSYEKVCVEAK